MLCYAYLKLLIKQSIIGTYLHIHELGRVEMDNLELSQELVDTSYMEAKREWNRMLQNSGQSQLMFIAVSSEATSFLYQYKNVQDKVREMGFKMPDLVQGVTVTEISENELSESKY